MREGGQTAVEKISRKHCRRRARGQDVARQLGTRNTEKHDRNHGPEQKKGRKPVGGLIGLLRIGANSLDDAPGSLRNRRHRENSPRQHRQKQDRNVIPERLRVLVEVGAKALQVVLNKENVKELRDLALNREIPRQHNNKEQQEARPPHAADTDLSL